MAKRRPRLPEIERLQVDYTLLVEQARHRAEQLQALTRISALISASLNPQEILEAVCQTVSRLTSARRCAIFLLESEVGQMWLAHSQDLSADFIRQSQSFTVAHNGRTRSLRTRQPVLTPDIFSANLEPELIQDLRREAILAFGDFPLITPEGPIGYLSVYFDSAHSFSSEEVDFLQTLASQAALAVSNARLHSRTDLALSQRAHQLSILEAVGRELAAATTSDQLFRMILDYACDFTNSPWGHFALYDPDRQIIEVKASKGYPQLLERFPESDGIRGRAVRTRQLVNVGDVQQDQDFFDLTDGKARSHLSIPLLHEERVLGVLTLEKPEPNGYLASEQAFVSQLANQAAIAVVNAELFSDVSSGRERLAAVLNSVNEGILMIDTEGHVILVNESIQALTGFSPEALLAAQFAHLPAPTLAKFGISPQRAEDLVEMLRNGLAPETSKASLEITDFQPERYFERYSLPVLGQDGQVTGWLIVLREVTSEREVAKAREFIAETLWHDLRSPLSTVLGAVGILEDEFARIESVDSLILDTIQVVKRGTKRVFGLTEALLDVARMESGKIELTPALIDLYTLAQGVLDEFTVLSGEYGVRLGNEIPLDLPKIVADAGKISRVLVNLVDNALKFTPAGGEITLAAEQQGESILVKVSDTGPGIPEAYREKIFERFAQVPGQRGRKRGTGIGLTFCRLVVEAHGGRIWVDSRPGGGSLFTFTLPLLILPAAPSTGKS